MTGANGTSLPGYSTDDLRARGAADTAREIAQQPDVWGEIAGDGSPTGARAAAPFAADRLTRTGARVLLTGAGTSAFAGRILAPDLARRLGRRVEAIATTDLVAAPRAHLAEDVPTLLVSFARSGDSPESVAATDLADELLGDVSHLIITCNPDGQLARSHLERPGSRVLLVPEAANDRGFAMTSSFTGMVLAGLLALGFGELEARVADLARAAAEVIAGAGSSPGELAAREPARIVYLGSGALTGLAAEAALKTLELTAGRVVAVSDSSLGFRHGPKSILDRRTAVVVFVSGDPHTRRYDLDILAELAGAVAPGQLRAVAGADAELGSVPAWRLPGVAGLPDAALALPAVVVAQLLALTLSLRRGLRPDNPFPAGEVNRVVQGVTVHPLEG